MFTIRLSYALERVERQCGFVDRVAAPWFEARNDPAARTPSVWWGEYYAPRLFPIQRARQIGSRLRW